MPDHDKIGRNGFGYLSDHRSRLANNDFCDRVKAPFSEPRYRLFEEILVAFKLRGDRAYINAFGHLKAAAVWNHRQEYDLGTTAPGHQCSFAQSHSSIQRSVIGKQDGLIHSRTPKRLDQTYNTVSQGESAVALHCVGNKTVCANRRMLRLHMSEKRHFEIDLVRFGDLRSPVERVTVPSGNIAEPLEWTVEARTYQTHEFNMTKRFN